ncbi:alpha/beta-hydrolase [Microthyrium microscopicum]|uniref:Alpha/beta-hydrolase n=1 Tax=Microthyrium microscopicum TaxID=703497 RepID=A0A6A6U2A2_9PEZI|nr:alpha/beta-hydrolase [Microthyrium microscopicum]
MAFSLPFLGRLYFIEYITLLISLLFLFLEGAIRIITLALPQPIINICYRGSRRLFNALSDATSKRSRNKKKAIVQSLVEAADFLELCELYGYTAEEHIVQTKDGYLLGLHRLAWRRGEYLSPVNAGPGSIQKKVIFCMHGLLMNSEVWVCLTDKERCLPFQLVEAGYDVWFGNNRGNKYSKKSTKWAPTEARFWSFSIDQFAFHDIPDSIDYILKATGQPSLSYIGFSQGTAQAFASLSVHPQLNQKVDVFIALAPAMAPPGLSSRLVNSLAKATPHFLFLAFGRKAILSSATMWEALLYPPIFVRLVDQGNAFLFGWKNHNMSPHQKLAAYPHLYSYTSTKSVVHWFQIIRNGKFQMYDDEIQGPLAISDTSKYYKVAKFPTRNIKTPIVLLYGGSDSLVDINVMLKELPHHAEVREIPHYEHLDFLWAHDVDQQVFPHVFAALKKYTMDGGLSPEHLVYPKSPYPRSANDSPDKSAEELTATEDESLQKHTENITGADSSSSTHYKTLPAYSPTTTSHTALTEQTSGSRPEGWWSSDDVAGTEPNTPSKIDKDMLSPTSPTSLKGSLEDRLKVAKKNSHSSLRSIDFSNERGIRIGVAKALGAVSQENSAQGITVSHESKDGKATKSGEGKKKLKKKLRIQA